MRARPLPALLFGVAGLAVALAACALGPPAAEAQPPIVRPPNESTTPPLELGRELFAANCASCHGSLGQGVLTPTPAAGASGISGQGPRVAGTGRRAVDFYLRTGYMPLAAPGDQPTRQRVQFTEREIGALEDYVDSLGGGPPIPRPDPASGNLAEGLTLFTEHCAGCHQAASAGGVVIGARVPPLRNATAVQVAQAVRIGPYLMPSFSTRAISDAQLNSLIRYVEYLKSPDDPGGWSIDRLGPFPEGMVTWLIAGVLLVATCAVIGERVRRR